MTSRKANVMLLNLTLRNFAAGEPAVNDSEPATVASSLVRRFTAVEEMSIHYTALFQV